MALAFVERSSTPLPWRRMQWRRRGLVGKHRLNPLEELPEAPSDRGCEVGWTDRESWRRLATGGAVHRTRGSVLPHLTPRLAPTLGTAGALFLLGHDLLRHGPGSNEGQLHHPNRTAAVAAGLRIGERPVADDAGGDRVAAGTPLGPPGDAHARSEDGRAHLTARTPGTEGELGDDEPAQHVRSPACAEAGLGEGSQERAADCGEALVGEDLDFGRVTGVGHKRGLSVEPPGPLEGGRGSGYAGCTVRSSVGSDPGQAPRVASFLDRIRATGAADRRTTTTPHGGGRARGGCAWKRRTPPPGFPQVGRKVSEQAFPCPSRSSRKPFGGFGSHGGSNPPLSALSTGCRTTIGIRWSVLSDGVSVWNRSGPLPGAWVFPIS